MKQSILLLMFSTAIYGQTQTVTISAPVPLPVAPFASYTGTPGASPIFYYVCARYPSGSVCQFSPAVAQQTAGIAALGGSNSVTISWNVAPGATGYDVMRFSSGGQFSGSCSACSIAQNVQASSFTDSSSATPPYTYSQAVLRPAAGQIALDNIDYTGAALLWNLGGVGSFPFALLPPNFTAGDCPEFAANPPFLADTGSPCGTGAGGPVRFQGTPTASAIITDYDTTHIQTPDPGSTLDGTGDLVASGSLTSANITSTGPVSASGNVSAGGYVASGVGGSSPSSYHYTDTGQAHDTVEEAPSSGYTGTVTRPAVAPITGQFLSACTGGTSAAECWANSSANITFTLPNDTTTGTTANKLVKLTTASGATTAILAAGTTVGIVGVAVSGAGTSGSVTIQSAGLVNCVFVGATTVDDYVTNDSTTGDCSDTGALTPPLATQVVGRVLSTNASAGTYQILLFGPGIIGAAAAGNSTTTAHTWLGNRFGTAQSPGYYLIGTSDTSVNWFATGGGTANAQTVTLTPQMSAYTAGAAVNWLPSNGNTGATTINVNALGVVSITKCGTTALASGDLTTTAVAVAVYDGTEFQLQNPQAVGCTGSGSLPVSAGIVGSNGSSQPVTATAATIAATNYVAGGGTANAQTVTLSPAAASYAAGMVVRWLPSNGNTSTVTLNVNGLGAKSLDKCGTTALASGDLTTTALAEAIYDGTEFQLTDPQAVGCAAASSVSFAGVTTGTNTAGTLTCSTGCTVKPGGTGVINATELVDANNLPAIQVSTVASQVDDLIVIPSATGSPAVVSLQGNGSDTGVGITLAGKDAAANATLGFTTLRGANQTSTSGSFSAAAAGGSLVTAGSNAASHTASQAGSVELTPGYSTNGGEPGVTIIGQAWLETTGSHTEWNLQCLNGATMNVADCGASPTSFLGVADFASGSAIQTHVPPSNTPINASAAVTLGHTVCAGATAGKVTDSGGTGPCPAGAGITVGTVIAVSGAWVFGDGDTATISTTLPLIAMRSTQQIGGGDLSAPPIHLVGATFSGGGTQSTQVFCCITAANAGTIKSWDITVDDGTGNGTCSSCTATVKFWRVATGTSTPTSSNSLNTSGFSLSSGTALHSTTLTDLSSTAIAANDIFAVQLSAVANAVVVTADIQYQ